MNVGEQRANTNHAGSWDRYYARSSWDSRICGTSILYPSIIFIIQGPSRSGRSLRVAAARYARSQGRMERNDRCSRWSHILGASRLPANAKSSMLQENNPDAACMLYVHMYTSFDMYSDWQALDFLLCARVIALRYAVLAVLLLQ